MSNVQEVLERSPRGVFEVGVLEMMDTGIDRECSHGSVELTRAVLAPLVSKVEEKM